jgi:hypothetical protein
MMLTRSEIASLHVRICLTKGSSSTGGDTIAAAGVFAAVFFTGDGRFCLLVDDGRGFIY